MRLLLDAHSFLWFITDSRRLSTRARTLMEDGTTDLFLSIASPWELAIKVSLGKLDLPQPVATFVRQQLEANAIDLLPITLEHVATISPLPFHHRDPFDRLLIAQSIVEGMPVISADTAFDAYPIERLW